MPYVLIECLSSSLRNKRKRCQAESLGPAKFNDCTTETSRVGSLRRVSECIQYFSNKGIILRQLQGHFPPSQGQLCLPPV